MDTQTIDAKIEGLTRQQKKVLKNILQGQSVSEIASATHVHPSTISKHLSGAAKAFGIQNQKGESYSLRWEVIEHFAQHKPDWVKPGLASGNPIEPELPDGPVPLDSPFYIERPPIETQCFEVLAKPSALIRIRAPRHMGKSSLMSRALAHTAEQHNATTALWDLMDVESSTCQSLEKFLKSFCWGVTQHLGLEQRLSDYWDGELLSNNQNCTTYFGEYLLPNVPGILVLGLDNIDRLFKYDQTAADFFAMLRGWHEKSKINPLWQKLRLILVHSTEEYVQKDVNQSPFNVGLGLEPPEFSLEQLQTLASRHGLIDQEAIHQQETPWAALYKMIGGHPYLVRLALYHLVTQKTSLSQLLQHAPTASGIYESHLREHWQTLATHPELLDATKQVVTATEPILLNPGHQYKLLRMGLVHNEGMGAVPRCELYRRYFSQVLG